MRGTPPPRPKAESKAGSATRLRAGRYGGQAESHGYTRNPATLPKGENRTRWRLSRLR